MKKRMVLWFPRSGTKYRATNSDTEETYTERDSEGNTLVLLIDQSSGDISKHRISELESDPQTKEVMKGLRAMKWEGFLNTGVQFSTLV